jgi:hypothetical protein
VITPVVVWVLCSALPMPRTLKSLPWPKLFTTTLGIANCSAVDIDDALVRRAGCPTAPRPRPRVVIRFSWRRCAVTTISSLSSSLAAGADAVLSFCGASCAAAVPQYANASADAPIHQALFMKPSPTIHCHALCDAERKVPQNRVGFNINYQPSEYLFGAVVQGAAPRECVSHPCFRRDAGLAM